MIGERVRAYIHEVKKTMEEPLPVFDGRFTRRAFVRGVAASGVVILAGGDVLRTPEDDYQPGVTDYLPEGTAEEIDNIKDFFISDHPETGLTGTHYIDQTIKVMNGVTYSIYEKYNNPQSFELHELGDDIKLIQDNSDPKRVYRLENGLLLKGKMKVGEKLHVNDYIQWFDEGCKFKKREPFAYEVTLEKHIENYPLGGDLGEQNAIVIAYQPFDPVRNQRGFVERNYYFEKWGWGKWELYDQNGEHLLQPPVVFNKLAGGKLRPPDPSVICFPDAIRSVRR